MRLGLFASLLFSFVLCACAVQAAPTCQLLKYAELPVTMIGRQPTIEAKIDGQSVRMVVDTGGFFTTIDRGEAGRLKMRPGVLPPQISMAGIGGEARDLDVVRAKVFQVGPFVAHDADFLTTATGGFGREVIGILGENFLSPYDVEFDLGSGMIRIFGTKGDCDHVVPIYWSNRYSTLPIEQDVNADNALIGEASVNGHKIRAIFDTGAWASMLSVRSAAKAGITPQSSGVRAAGVSAGFGKGQVTTWIASLDSFAVGDETINHTQMQMGALDLTEGADMLLGADFFLAHRVFISAKRRRVWFTYSGGPVFSLQTRAGTADDGTAPAGSAPTAATDTPKDADGFSRRAGALLARGQIQPAIADLDHAVALEPKVEQHYVDRARARVASRQQSLAMADVEQALTLKPADPQALMIRGSLYLNQRDETRAQ